MKEAGINPDVVSNNSLISGAVRKCSLQNSLRMFDEMLQSRREIYEYGELYCYD
jgi:pentatricopeptide repeat protein